MPLTAPADEVILGSTADAVNNEEKK